MKTSLFLILLSFSQFALAGQVAQCLGTLVLDNSPVTAKVYSDNGTGRVMIETPIDTTQSPATVDLQPDSTVTIGNNNFQMNFSVSQAKSSSTIQAFRDGAFFVEDFYCIRVN
jgi:hypothetical protein